MPFTALVVLRYVRNNMLRSRVALEILLALTQRAEPTRLRGLASAVGRRDSSVQSALRTLLQSGLVRRTGDGYALSPAVPPVALLLDLALREVNLADALRALLGGNEGIEFAALHGSTLYVVYRRSVSPSDEVRFTEFMRAHLPAVVLRLLRHEYVPQLLETTPTLREELRAGRRLKGDTTRLLRDRDVHGDFAHARRLRRLSAKLRQPSARSIAQLARTYDLAHLGVFGSAVRSDFRPESDVDVLVSFQPSAPASVFDLVDLRDALEALFNRDVDVLVAATADPRILETARREEVTLYGRTR